MPESQPSFFARIGLAFVAFFRTLFDPVFAAGIERLRGEPQPEAAPLLKESSPDAALQLLGLLQQEGRFLDFIAEDVAGYADAEIGAAVRVVHEGCRKALYEHFTIEAVRPEQEGARLTLPDGFDASAVRLTGNVVGQAPFSGTLVHRGWRVSEVRLPKVVEGHNVRVLAPAEVEL
jgi:hypothetical protein